MTAPTEQDRERARAELIQAACMKLNLNTATRCLHILSANPRPPVSPETLADVLAEAGAAFDAVRAEQREADARLCDKSEKFHAQLAAIASDPNDMGVLKHLARSGEAQRLAAAIRATAAPEKEPNA